MKRLKAEVLMSAVICTLAAAAAACHEAVRYDSCDNLCTENEVCIDAACYPKCSDGQCEAESDVCIEGACRPAASLNCVPNSKKCNDDKTEILICNSNLKFEFYRYCEEDQICESGSCTSKSCEKGAMRCSKNNVEKCDGQTFRIYSQCNNDQMCDPDRYTCIAKECSEEEQKRCHEDNVQICKSGRWTDFESCNNAPCDPETNRCVTLESCVNGQKECNGKNYNECENGRWIAKECPGNTSCHDGTCKIAECTNDEVRCSTVGGSQRIELCQNNVFTVHKICADDQICEAADGIAKCRTPETPQTDTCGNGILDKTEECDGSLFPENASCSTLHSNGSLGQLKCTNTCKIDTSDCRLSPACQNGETKCRGNIYMTCEGNSWIETDCEAQNSSCDSQRGCVKNHSNDPSAKHHQDFEKLTDTSSYSNTTVLEDKNNTIKYNLTGRGEDDNALSGKYSMAMTKKVSAKNKLEIVNIENGVRDLTFKWRAFSSQKGIYIIKINDKEVGSIDLKDKDKEMQTWTMPADKSVTGRSTILIIPESYEGTSNAARVIIDDVIWYDNP